MRRSYPQELAIRLRMTGYESLFANMRADGKEAEREMRTADLANQVRDPD